MADNLLREIDEELVRERWAGFARAHKGLLAVGAVIAILAVAAPLGWRLWSADARAANAQQLSAALAADPESRTAALIELAANARPGYAVLARFALADAEQEAALAAMRGIIDSGDAPAVLSELAHLRYVDALVRAGDHDTARAQLERTSPGPYRALYLLLEAEIAIAAGDLSAAREVVREVADDLTASSSTRSLGARILRALEHHAPS